MLSYVRSNLYYFDKVVGQSRHNSLKALGKSVAPPFTINRQPVHRLAESLRIIAKEALVYSF